MHKIALKLIVAASLLLAASCAWCAVGTDIITGSVACKLFDSNGADAPIACQALATSYGTLPSTVDPTKQVWTWTTSHNSDSAVFVGWNTNTTYYGIYNSTVGTSHTVVVDGMVPGQVYSSYLGSCQRSTSGAYTPVSNTCWSSYPGPSCSTGDIHCYIVTAAPNPLPTVPMSFVVTPLGPKNIAQGFPLFVPVMMMRQNGEFLFSALPSSPTTNTLVRILDCTSNSGNCTAGGGTSKVWAKWTGSAWAISVGDPVFEMITASLSDGTNTYPCSANSAGSATCVTSGGTDSHIAVVPQYPNWTDNNSGADFRGYLFDSTHSLYRLDIGNVIAPVSNPMPNMAIEFATNVGGTTPTGTWTLTAAFRLYTDFAAGTAAAGTADSTVTYAVNVTSVPTLAASTPTPTTDSYLPTFAAITGPMLVNYCSSASITNSLSYWASKNQWMWYAFSAITFGELYSWNYDGNRVYKEGSDFFLHPMSGGNWSDWHSSTSYGTALSNIAILPTTGNAGGYVFLAITPGSSGSGSHPTFDQTVGHTFSDGGVTWENVGNQAYWNSCSLQAGEGFRNNAVLTGERGQRDYSNFTGGSLMDFYRTGDATPKDGSYQVGLNKRILIDDNCANNSGACAADNAGPSGQYGAGAFNVFGASVPRGIAYQLEAIAGYWQVNGSLTPPASSSPSNALQRMAFYQINTILAIFDSLQNQSPLATSWAGSAATNSVHAFFIGLDIEALIDFESVAKYQDPSNTQGLQDPRIPAAIKAMADWMYVNWWNVNGDNYAFSYTPGDVNSDTGTLGNHFAELNLQVSPAYSWLYDYCGGTPCTLPGGTSYAVASDLMRQHSYDGRTCSKTNCSVWGVANSPLVIGPKEVGQWHKWGLGDDYPWRLALQSPWTTILLPSKNPCWDGSNGSSPCSGPKPYADTEPPYQATVINEGSWYQQDDPGNEGVYTGQAQSPIQSVTTNSGAVTWITYEQTASTAVHYGTSTSCASTATAEDATYPKLVSLYGSNIEAWRHLVTLTGLTSNTTYYVGITNTDIAGNSAGTSCVANGFQGNGIHFKTSPTSIVVTPTSIPNGQVGVSYPGATFSASGGTGPYVYTIGICFGSCISHNIPGLALNPTTGAYTGTPTGSGGGFTISVMATDSLLQTGAVLVNMTIAPASGGGSQRLMMGDIFVGEVKQ